MSAQQARQRKERYVHELEWQVASKDEQIRQLQTDLKKAATTNTTLQRLLLTMRNSGSRDPASGAQALGNSNPASGIQAAGSSGNGISSQARPALPSTQLMRGGYAAQHAQPRVCSHGMATQQSVQRSSCTGGERHAERTGAMHGQAMAHMQSHRLSYPCFTQHLAMGSPAVAPPASGPVPMQIASPRVTQQSWRPNSGMHNYSFDRDIVHPPYQGSLHGGHATSRRQPSALQSMQAMPAQRTSMQHAQPKPPLSQHHRHRPQQHIP